MLVWSGWGILVVIIPIVILLIAETIMGAITGSELPFQENGWAQSLSFIISGVACWYLGKYMNKPSDRVLVDKETGEEVLLEKAEHKLFFIKMEYWGPILGILGIVSLFS